MSSLIKKQRPDLSSEIDRMVVESEHNFKTPAGPQRQPAETSPDSKSKIRSEDQQGPSDSEMLDSPLAKKQIDFDKPRACAMQLDHNNTQSDAAVAFDLLRSMDCSAVKLVNFVAGEVSGKPIVTIPEAIGDIAVIALHIFQVHWQHNLTLPVHLAECHPEVVEKYFPSLNSSQIETHTSDNEAWVQWLERVKEVNDFCQSEEP